MTHFDRCAPGHVLLAAGQMQAKEYIMWIVCLFVCVKYMGTDIAYPALIHVCASSSVCMFPLDRIVGI